MSNFNCCGIISDIENVRVFDPMKLGITGEFYKAVYRQSSEVARCLGNYLYSLVRDSNIDGNGTVLESFLYDDNKFFDSNPGVDGMFF